MQPMSAHIDEQTKKSVPAVLPSDTEALVEHADREKRNDNADDAHTSILRPGSDWTQPRADR
jgi:hypothetical protein